MKFKIPSLIVLLISGLMIPTVGIAEIGKRPDVPSTFVSEIGNGYWIRVTAKLDTLKEAGQAMRGELDLAPYTKRAQIVADWTCTFWNRKAIVMSVTNDTEYLFACAVE